MRKRRGEPRGRATGNRGGPMINERRTAGERSCGGSAWAPRSEATFSAAFLSSSDFFSNFSRRLPR